MNVGLRLERWMRRWGGRRSRAAPAEDGREETTDPEE